MNMVDSSHMEEAILTDGADITIKHLVLIDDYSKSPERVIS